VPAEIVSPDIVQAAIPGISEIGVLNTGGFKVVYKAKINGIWEALKLIEIQRFLDLHADEEKMLRQELRSLIFREIGILETVHIPELVSLGSLHKSEFTISGRDFVIYSEEMIKGDDLWCIIRRNAERPSQHELCTLFIILLKAIKALWAQGYIHRDIKPANVMRTNNPQRPFILMDLGIAFSIHDTALTFNAAGRLPPATFRYIDPEMLNPAFRDNIDFRSDLYTAGMTVFEYASFTHPLARDRDDLITTFSRALKQMPKKLSELRTDLAPGLCDVIDQMLKKKRALRPTNINAVIKKLEAFL